MKYPFLRSEDTKDNTADCASRGLRGKNSSKLALWLNGPRFLQRDESCWPEQFVEILEISNEDNHFKEQVHVHAVCHVSDTLHQFVNRFSCWYRVQIAMNWQKRWKLYLQAKTSVFPAKKIRCGPLTVTEIQVSTEEIIKIVQRD